MSAVPSLYIPKPREVARHLMLRRWLATLAELAAVALFVAAVVVWSALASGA